MGAEDEDSVWEKRKETTKIFHNILKTGLKIDNPEQIELVDIHRLPQHPVKKSDGSTFHRPVKVCLYRTYTAWRRLRRNGINKTN